MKRILVACASVLVAVGVSSTAYAPATITAPVDGSGSGALPSARWGDLTGSGAGWQGSIAATNFVYTGNWTPLNSAPALSSDTSSSYTGTADGDTYTVQVTGVSGSTIDFSYTSTNGASGTGSGTAGTATSVGTRGLTITFASSSTYASGNSYQIQVGTQNPSALILNNSSSSATISPYNSSTSTPPTFVNSTATLSQGWTATNGTAFADYGGCPSSWELFSPGSGIGATYTFTIAAGNTETISYGIPAYCYLNNSPAVISINNSVVATVSQGQGGIGSTNGSTSLILWTDTLPAGT